MPTAAVVLTLFAHVTIVHLELDDTKVRQVHGWQEHHRLICDALGVSYAWYEIDADSKNSLTYFVLP